VDSLTDQRVLVLHHAYREPGGEERYAGQLFELLQRRAGAVHSLSRLSSETGSGRAAAGLLSGGLDPSEVARVVKETGTTVVHAHNIHPTYGWRALAAARRAGAAVVLHLHNYRLYCSIGIAFRDGHDCDQCARRRTWHAVAHNCRDSVPESAVYGAALGLWQRRLIDSVDVFASPTARLAQDLEEQRFDLPLEVLPTWLPDGEFVSQSACADGEYALFAGRVTEDKGVFVAIEASARSGVPLRIAGDGPAIDDARELVSRLRAPVEFLGHVNGQALVAARMGAAFCVVPSLWREVLPFSALEALAAGLPLVVSGGGGLDELTDQPLVAERGSASSLESVMRLVFEDRTLRAEAGARSLERARARFSEQAYVGALTDVYDRAVRARAAG
jgi:glycosyltransferase involved in cell wall biosynthesis